MLRKAYLDLQKCKTIFILIPAYLSGGSVYASIVLHNISLLAWV